MSKKNNNTGAKWVVAIFVSVFICSILITELMASSDNGIDEINITKYKNELSLENEKLILLTEDNCTECDEMSLVLEQLEIAEDLTVLSMNVDKLSDADKQELLNSSDLISLDTLPAVLHVSTGKVIGIYTEAANADAVMSFMEVFKKITVEDYVDMMKDDKEYIIYIGRPTCGYCVQSQPWLKRIAFDLDKDVYYINIDEESSTDLQLLSEKTDGIYSGATPLFLIVKGGKVLDYQEGAGSYTSLKAFFDGDDEE